MRRIPGPATRRVLPLLLILCVAPLAHPCPAPAQVEPAGPEDQELGDLIRLFLDCQGRGCHDMDYFRREIQFVNWVRDQRDAHVHLLITSQSTGAGGSYFDLAFLGRGEYEEESDTLHYVSAYDATSDEIREGLAGIIKIGLMRYVGLTPVAQDIRIDLREPESQEAGVQETRPAGATVDPEDDPWNFWVFNASVSGGFGGESSQSSNRFSGSFSANRTTEEWKASLRVSSRYNENSFDYEEYTSTSVRRDHTFSGSLVKSLGPQWSAGLRSSLTHSTFYNYDLSASAAPVLEYNVFPYSESSRRSLTIQYAVEAGYSDYRTRTIYLEDEETLLSQSLTVGLNLRQPWGSAHTSLDAAHYFHDLDLHHVTLFGLIDIRLARGLSLNVMGSGGRVKDRISVGYQDATTEELLLRRRLLETDYEYSMSIGFRYRFGSVFNNIVNPRLGGGMGGPVFFGF